MLEEEWGLCVPGVKLSHCGRIQIYTVLPRGPVPVNLAYRGWTSLSSVKRVGEGAEQVPSLQRCFTRGEDCALQGTPRHGSESTPTWSVALTGSPPFQGHSARAFRRRLLSPLSVEFTSGLAGQERAQQKRNTGAGDSCLRANEDSQVLQ